MSTLKGISLAAHVRMTSSPTPECVLHLDKAQWCAEADLIAQMDLGACPHAHSAKLKTEYETSMSAASDPNSTAEMKYTLQDLVAMRTEYERNIMSFVDDCDRRIRAAQRRLEKTPEENNKTTSLVSEPTATMSIRS